MLSLVNVGFDEAQNFGGEFGQNGENLLYPAVLIVLR
jgi:hypothetical protein